MANYPQRFQRVLEHIDHHLHESLSSERLSRVACLSRFHFHRQFSAVYGVTLSSYIAAARMKRASYQLAFRRKQCLLEIALDNGYGSSEAFSRAFHRYYGQSPSQFRRTPDWHTWSEKLESPAKLRNQLMQIPFNSDAVELINSPETHLGVYEHCGAPETLGKSIRAFIAWRREYGATPDVSRTFNILYDDPSATPAAEYRFDLGAEVDAPVPENRHGIVNKTLPGGLCARLRLTGPDSELAAAIAWLYREWLPTSDHELRDFPLYLERLRFYPEVPERDMITDVFLPLR